MLRFIMVRLFQALLTVFIAGTIVFLLARFQGDPADVLLPPEATQEAFERLRAFHGLDQPLHVQYGRFIGSALQGDFGNSIADPTRSAMGMAIERLPATFTLAGAALLIAALIAIPIGVLSAVRKGSRLDRFGRGTALFGQSVPDFWLGIVLMWIFAVNLGWLRTSGFNRWADLILPAVALGWYQVAVLMRLTRSGMLESLSSEYVKLARMKGVPEWRIIWAHALKNAAIVPLTYFGIIIAALMTGSVIIETVFSWPGTGRLAIDSVRRSDYPVVQAVIMLFTVIFALASLLVDILYAYLDPRIRYSRT